MSELANQFAERKSTMSRAASLHAQVLGNNSRIEQDIPSAKKLTAMASTSTISRRAIHGVSFPEFVFPLSPESISKESLACDPRLTFTFRIKTSKSLGSQSKRKSSRS